MNQCLCIERDIRKSPIYRLSPSHCCYECEDKSEKCGGENAYNIYENQRGAYTCYDNIKNHLL